MNFNEWNELLGTKRNKTELKYDSKKLFLKPFCYYVSLESEESTDKEEATVLTPMAPLEDDEEVKLDPKETLADRVKLNPQNKMNMNRIKNLDTRPPIL